MVSALDVQLAEHLRPWLTAHATRNTWMADAACREHRELDYFPARGVPASALKAVCSGCLVRAECRYQPGHRWRSWGGT